MVRFWRGGEKAVTPPAFGPDGAVKSADGSQGAETSSGNTEQEAEQKDPVATALDDPAFVKFLDRFDSKPDMSTKEGKETIQKRHERFQKIDGMIKDVKDILAEGFSADMTTEHMSMGIKPEDIEAAKDYVEGLAADESPTGLKAFDTMLDDIGQFRDLETACADAIEAVDTKEADVRAKIPVARGLSEMGGMRLRYSKEEKATMAEAKKLGLDREDGGANKDIIHQDITDLRGLREDATTAMTAYEQKRNELMTKWEHDSGALKLARAKFAESASIDSGKMTLDELSARAKHHDALKARREAREKNEESGRFDYYDSSEIGGSGEYKAELDKEAEEVFRSEMQRAIEKTPLKNALSNLRTELHPLITREDIGTKDAKKSKEFVISVLQENYSRYTKGTDEEKQKSWAIKAILEVDFETKADPDFLPDDQEGTEQEDVRDIPEIEQRQIDQEIAEQSAGDAEQSEAASDASTAAPSTEIDPGPEAGDTPPEHHTTAQTAQNQPYRDGSPVHDDQDAPPTGETSYFSDEEGHSSGPTTPNAETSSTHSPETEAPRTQQQSPQPRVAPQMPSAPSMPGYQTIQHTNPTARIETPVFDGGPDFSRWDNNASMQSAAPSPESDKENVPTAP